MRDLLGFVLLLVAVTLGLFLLVQFVLPFLLQYFFGLALYFGFATYVLRRYRVHPVHLSRFLRPGVAKYLVLAALAVPCLQSGVYYLFDIGPSWQIVLVLNGVLPLVWSIRTVLSHREQKHRYTIEGHDLEDMLEHVASRKAALEMRRDLLVSASEHAPRPEPWELAAGIEPVSVEFGATNLSKTLDAVNSLLPEWEAMQAQVDAMLEDVRTGRVQGTHPQLREVTESMAGLDKKGREAIARADALLADWPWIMSAKLPTGTYRSVHS